MMRVIVLGVTAWLAFMPSAQAVAPDDENGRYTFQQIQGGMMRLDTRTGQVSRCTERATGWACQAAADDRLALENEISRLQGENAALKQQLTTHGLGLPNGVAGQTPQTKSADQDLKLPSEADIDRMMSFMEKIWRRLVGMVADMQKDLQKESREPNKN